VPTCRHSDTDQDAPLLSRPDNRTGRSSHADDGLGGSRVSTTAALACADLVGVGVGVGSGVAVSAGVGVGVADGEVVMDDGVGGVSAGLGVSLGPANTCATSVALATAVPMIAWIMPPSPWRRLMRHPLLIQTTPVPVSVLTTSGYLTLPAATETCS
jgi:hypothetical protein